MEAPPPGPSPLARLARIALALALGLLLVELGLRVAGRLYLDRRAGDEELADDGALRLVCHGDSCVFGLWVDAEDAWPAQLQARLEASAPPPVPRVVNLGMPGLNTRMLRRNLEQELDRYRPDVLLLTVGANNSWTWLSGADIYYDDAPWYEQLKLVKLVRLLARRLAGPGSPAAAPADYDPSVELSRGQVAHVPNREGDVLRLDEGDGERVDLDDEAMQQSIRTDLAAVHASCVARGIDLVLVGYGAEAGMYGDANRALASSAVELGVPFVPTAPALAEEVERLGFDRVFFEDHHPQPAGYARIAREVHRALLARGTVAGEPAAALAAADPAVAGEAPHVRAVGSGASLALEVDGGPPERELRLLLWGAHGPDEPAPRYASAEELRRDPLYALTLEADWARTRFDAAGHARVALAPLLALVPNGNPSGVRLRAAYIVLGRAGGGWNRRTPPADVTLP